MKPLIWRNPEGFPHKCWMNYNWRKMHERTNSVIFMQGRPLPCEDVGPINCSMDTKEYDLIFASEVAPAVFKRFDCLPNNATSMPPLVNQKVLEILNKHCPDDIQAFPATIVPEKGSKQKFENHDYWVINITKLVDAIDLEKSDVEFFDHDPRIEDAIRTINKLAFIDSEEFDIPLIKRIKNKRSMEIVSPILTQAFKEARVTGVAFVEDKDY